LPLPPSVDVTFVVTLLFVPVLVPVTFTENVQLAPVPSVAPERETVPEPAAAVMVPPPHDPDKPFGVATAKPEGRVSVKPTPDSDALRFGLFSVKLSQVEPPTGMVCAPNDFEIEGGAVVPAVRIVSDALAVVPLPPLSELTLPVVLVAVPTVLLVTSKDVVQVDPGNLMLPPASDTPSPPGSAMIDVKPQRSVKLVGPASDMPAGSESLIDRLVIATEFDAGLPKVNVTVAV